MQKQGLSPGRLAVIVLFTLSVFGLLLFLWLSFGGPIPLNPKGWRFSASFPEATQLAKQADVRVAGVAVGKVVDKRRDVASGGNRTLAVIELEPKYAPLRSDARAILRQKTLLGETYVELTTGTKSARPLPENGRLANAQAQPTVELDELLEIFDSRTRSAFQLWQRDLARSTAGRAQNLNDSFGNLPGFVDSGTSLLEVLDGRRAALSSQVRNTAVTFAALTQNEGQLRNLITDTRVVFDSVAAERNDLATAIRIFPTFLDETKSTLARLQTFARETDPLLLDLEPTLRDLRPTLVSLNELSPDLQKLFEDLTPLIDASVAGLPAMARTFRGLEPTLGRLGPFLEELNPILEWLQLHQQTTSDFISMGASALGNTEPTPNPDGQGHVLPQLIMIGDQTLLSRRRARSNRGNTYINPGALAEKVVSTQQALPNWDCAPSGGEQGPGQGEPILGFFGNPGCFVQRPLPFQGKKGAYPNVEREDYRAGP